MTVANNNFVNSVNPFDNIGTLVYRDKIYESVELTYMTPEFHDVERTKVFVCRTREEGLDTFFTSLVFMAYPEFDIQGNCLSFSGMVPVNFEPKEENSPPSFSQYQYYEFGRFKFYPYYCMENVPKPEIDSD